MGPHHHRHWRHHHPHWRHRPRRGLAVRFFLRARLRRRIFAWFGASILATGLLVAAGMALVGRGTSSWWNDQLSRVQRFVGNQFAQVWHDPVQRAVFTEQLARDLQVDVRLLSLQGETLQVAGGACPRPQLEVPVVKGGAALGRVQFCLRTERAEQPWRGALALFLAFAGMWGASGWVARRLSRPLESLTEVVQELGRGNYAARAQHRDRDGDEFRLVADALNEMAARIEKQMRDQRELLATVSHELRTPLARVRILTEMGRDGSASPNVFDEVDREVVEMDALVAELLAHSRVEFGALSLRPLDATDLARRALERAGEDFGKLSAPEGTVQVQADATLLLRALGNLVDNAKKHGGGVARLHIRREEGWVWFDVEDAGPGVPEAEQARIFEPFQRGGGRNVDGLGLGLALVQRIAHAHGGKAHVENLPGGGARVSLAVRAASVSDSNA